MAIPASDLKLILLDTQYGADNARSPLVAAKYQRLYDRLYKAADAAGLLPSLRAHGF